MIYAPIGSHGWWCDEGDRTRMCDWCRRTAEPHEPDDDPTPPGWDEPPC